MLFLLRSSTFNNEYVLHLFCMYQHLVDAISVSQGVPLLSKSYYKKSNVPHVLSDTFEFVPRPHTLQQLFLQFHIQHSLVRSIHYSQLWNEYLHHHVNSHLALKLMSFESCPEPLPPAPLEEYPGVPRPDKRCNPSSVSWVRLGGSGWNGVRGVDLQWRTQANLCICIDGYKLTVWDTHSTNSCI